MKRSRQYFFYALTIIGFGVLLYWIITNGKLLQIEKQLIYSQQHYTGVTDHPRPHVGPIRTIANDFFLTFENPLSMLLLQIVIIMAVARLFGHFFRKMGQPTVIGEIIAGIVLGPSLIGYYFPGVFNFVFPPGSVSNLQLISHFGLIFFMFIIGMELNIKELKHSAPTAVVVSHSSIIIPFSLGLILAFFLFPHSSGNQTSFMAFALFMGIAMSITAFPVLARIIQERELTRTRLGTMALTCGAINDITAWCILATVIAIVKSGTFTNAIYTILIAMVYTGVMIFAIKPAMAKIGDIYHTRDHFHKRIVALVLAMLLLSSYITELIGIHALFGAFLAGTIMPDNMKFKKVLIEKIEDISLVIFLPLFFASTGLRTEIGLLNTTNLWMICLVVIAVAITGKFGGSAIAARLGGFSWKESLSLGALMNTRGLMELIVLTIGLELGILTPEIFTILVIMAIVTTLMTAPTLSLINYFYDYYGRKAPSEENLPYKVLISFGPPKIASTLLKLAEQIAGHHNGNTNYTALHITPSSEISRTEALSSEQESFKHLLKTSQQSGIPVTTRYIASEKVNAEIIKTCNKGEYDLLLMDGPESPLSIDLIGGKNKPILSGCKANIGILVNRNFSKAERILLISDGKYKLSMEITRSLLKNSASSLTLVVDEELKVKSEELEQIFSEFKSTKAIEIISSRNFDNKTLPNYDLMVINIDDWRNVCENRWLSLNNIPSVLITKQNKN